MSTTNIETDLNATIAAAINAKVEAGVFAALAGDEVLGKYVAAALNEPIEIPRNGSSYDKIKTTYLRHTINQALKKAVHDAVAKFIEGEQAVIEAEVAKALRKQASEIGRQFAEHLASQTIGRAYGVNVELRFPNQ